MKEVKQTPVPLPGSISKIRQQLIQPLSKETIDSSDDSTNETPAPKPKAKPTKTKTPINITIHKPNTNGVRKQSEVPLPSRTPVPPKPVVEKLETESSSSGDSDNEDTESAKQPTEKKDESSGSDSSSSSESSSEESEAETQQPTQQQQPRPTTSHTVDFRPAQSFVPPAGFTPLSTPLDMTSQTASIFQNLGGKQIWHITAPAGISISDLKEVVMEDAQSGEAVFTQDGVDYGFAVEQDEEVARHVLVPRSNGYRAVETPIDRTLHLQEVPRLPHLGSKQADQNMGSEAAASITRSTIRAPRPQVKGLKMRYFHSGFGDQDPGTIGSSDSETEAPRPAGLGVMSGTHAPTRIEKRKHDQVNGVKTSESPVKKHKKHKTPEEIKERAEKKARKERKKGKERTKS